MTEPDQPAPRAHPLPPAQPRGPGGQFAPTRRRETAAEQTAPLDVAELRRLLAVERAPQSIAWPVVVGLGATLAIVVAGAVLVLLILVGHGLL